MEEQLISFETAKLAKEKGFIVERYPYYTGPDTIVTHSVTKCLVPHYFAATQSLLQKWLREVHQLHITIYSCSQESWMCRITRPGQSLECGMYGEDYDTYEDALEDSLYMALKTI